MSPLTDEAPLALDRPDLVHSVREVLDRAGYNETQIPELCGLDADGKLTFGVKDRPRLLWRTRDGSPLSTLIRLFMVGVPVELEALGRAVAPMDAADWAALGLIQVEGTTARRAVALGPHGKLITVSDHARPTEGQRHNHVMSVSGTTLFLANITIRPPARRALDLGTGGGYQALRAAAHSQRVVGTDRNPRAVTVARFNAQLNAISNVDFAVGDLFEPAGDEPFDLIVANPPFIVSPVDEFQFRDSGLEGDGISERIIRQAPAHLAEGGLAQVLCGWVWIAGQDARQRVAGWLEGSGCDAWIISVTEPADVYAAHWLGQGDLTDPKRLAASFDRWMAYYKQMGIEAVDTGVITLRRRSGGANWIRFDSNRRENHPNGVALQAGFAARDLLERHGSDEDLLNLRLRCRPEMRLVQRLEPTASGWLVETVDCVLGKGLKFTGEMDQALFHVLTLCRGQLPLSAVLAQAAARTKQGVDAIAPGCLATVRSLIDQCFLWPNEEETVAS